MTNKKRYFLSNEVRPLAQRSDLMGFLLVIHCYGTTALTGCGQTSNVFTFLLTIMVIGSRQLGLAKALERFGDGFAKKILNDKKIGHNIYAVFSYDYLVK